MKVELQYVHGAACGVGIVRAAGIRAWRVEQLIRDLALGEKSMAELAEIHGLDRFAVLFGQLFVGREAGSLRRPRSRPRCPQH